jgi:hypothetical protein
LCSSSVTWSHDVAGADLLDVAAAGLDAALAFGDVEGLAEGVGSARRCGPTA